MIDRQILLRHAMVKAILDGRKTQTRRAIKPQPVRVGNTWVCSGHSLDSKAAWADFVRDQNLGAVYGKPGDRLWVPETWKFFDWDDDGRPKIQYRADDATLWRDPPDEWSGRIENIWEELSRPANVIIDGHVRDRRWRSPITMPRWAARTILEITNIRVERVQDISEADARAEGLRGPVERPLSSTVVEDYADLWDSINGAGSWDTNPWVWAITFRRQP